MTGKARSLRRGKRGSSSAVSVRQQLTERLSLRLSDAAGDGAELDMDDDAEAGLALPADHDGQHGRSFDTSESDEEGQSEHSEHIAALNDDLSAGDIAEQKVDAEDAEQDDEEEDEADGHDDNSDTRQSDHFASKRYVYDEAEEDGDDDEDDEAANDSGASDAEDTLDVQERPPTQATSLRHSGCNFVFLPSGDAEEVAVASSASDDTDAKKRPNLGGAVTDNHSSIASSGDVAAKQGSDAVAATAAERTSDVAAAAADAKHKEDSPTAAAAAQHVANMAISAAAAATTKHNSERAAAAAADAAAAAAKESAAAVAAAAAAATAAKHNRAAYEASSHGQSVRSLYAQRRHLSDAAAAAAKHTSDVAALATAARHEVDAEESAAAAATESHEVDVAAANEIGAAAALKLDGKRTLPLAAFIAPGVEFHSIDLTEPDLSASVAVDQGDHRPDGSLDLNTMSAVRLLDCEQSTLLHALDAAGHDDFVEELYAIRDKEVRRATLVDFVTDLRKPPPPAVPTLASSDATADHMELIFSIARLSVAKLRTELKQHADAVKYAAQITAAMSMKSLADRKDAMGRLLFRMKTCSAVDEDDTKAADAADEASAAQSLKMRQIDLCTKYQGASNMQLEFVCLAAGASEGALLDAWDETKSRTSKPRDRLLTMLGDASDKADDVGKIMAIIKMLALHQRKKTGVLLKLLVELGCEKSDVAGAAQANDVKSALATLLIDLSLFQAPTRVTDTVAELSRMFGMSKDELAALSVSLQGEFSVASVCLEQRAGDTVDVAWARTVFNNLAKTCDWITIKQDASHSAGWFAQATLPSGDAATKSKVKQRKTTPNLKRKSAATQSKAAKAGKDPNTMSAGQRSRYELSLKMRATKAAQGADMVAAFQTECEKGGEEFFSDPVRSITCFVTMLCISTTVDQTAERLCLQSPNCYSNSSQRLQNTVHIFCVGAGNLFAVAIFELSGIKARFPFQRQHTLVRTCVPCLFLA